MKLSKSSFGSIASSNVPLAFGFSNTKQSRKLQKGQMIMWGEDDNFYGNNQIPKNNNFSTGGTTQKRSEGRNLAMDENGRTVRKRRPRRDFEASNDDDWGGGNVSIRRNQSFNNDNDDWGGDDGFSIDSNGNSNGDALEPYEYSRPPSKNRRGNSNSRGGGGRGRGRGWREDSRGGGRGRGRGDNNFDRRTRMNERDRETQNSGDAKDRKINLRALESAGFVHLYGLAPVINALKANRRDLSSVESIIDLELLEGEDLEHEMKQRERKPEAQFTPWLFIQENMKYGSNSRGGKTGDKAVAAQEVEELAKQMGVPIAHVDKGVLNTLCSNRPHQGYILRCGSIEFEPKSQIPHPDDKNSPSLWLCLDEVVDPQNFGALLRSAYFLGGGGVENDDYHTKIGIMVCSKNSAPPTPVVSAASAGALELCNVYTTSNLPRTLNGARENGWRVLGAAASVPDGMIDESTGQPALCQDLNEVEVDDSKPTILVLGSEGHGLRKLVSRACSGFVRIPGNVVSLFDDESQAGVDSLNVSVTGGIMLWHFLSKQ